MSENKNKEEDFSQVVLEANHRVVEKGPTRGAGSSAHVPAKRIKNAHKKMAKHNKGIAGSLKSFAREQVKNATPDAEDAKKWLNNKATLAHKGRGKKSGFAKKAA